METGPALLINHGCALDKKSGSGKPKIERLAFVRIRDVAALPSDRQGLLRSKDGELEPFEVMYLGHVPTIGEAYVSMSDPYHVPARHFGVVMQTFGDGEESRLALTEHDHRVGRLNDEAVLLFRRKWIAYWTRLSPVVAPNEPRL